MTRSFVKLKSADMKLLEDCVIDPATPILSRASAGDAAGGLRVVVFSFAAPRILQASGINPESSQIIPGLSGGLQRSLV
jgi:hypothetical protein